MFVDIVDFTSFAEKNLPYDIVHALNRFFDATGRVIDKNNGYIDKYLGDGVMAIFGLKTALGGNPCDDAIRAALEIGTELERINRYIQQHLGETFRIGIGIDYGAVVVGNIGSRLRRQFTALGDVVNVAARLEMEAKRCGVKALVSAAAHEEASPGAFVFGDVLRLAIKGKATLHEAYVVASLTDARDSGLG